MNITSAILPFYARYFHANSTSVETNFFNTENLEEIRISYPNVASKIDALQSSDVLKIDGNDILVPLEGKLVVPVISSTENVPFVLIGHGNALSYFAPRTIDTLLPDPVLSYTGYEVLQNELGRNGIASLSINLNIVNAIGSTNDFYHRIQLFFLHFLLMKYLSGESVTIPGSDPHPIKFLVGTELKTMEEALTMADTPGSDTALQGLQSLKTSLNGKIDFTKLGFMGHSRGASAVSRIFEYFFTGSTAGQASSEFAVNPELDNTIITLVDYAGRPVKDHVKCIFALQPDETTCKIESDQTMFFVVAGSHDEDVGGRAASIYESVDAPKVMMFVHGGTHTRFNYAWRSLTGSISRINDIIAGDPVVRILSNQKHDEISRVVFSSFFRATLKNDTTQFLYFSRDVRYPIRIDIQRAWNFGLPFQALPNAWKKFDDDLMNTDILNATGTGAPDVTLPFKSSSSSYTSSGSGTNTLELDVNLNLFGSDTHLYLDFTDQTFSAFLYLKNRNADTATLTIPVSIDLGDYTHFSFRFAKWYKVENYAITTPSTPITGIPRRVDLRNFTIQLFEDDTAIGIKIDGENVRSLLHRAYPALKYIIGVEGPSRYEWDTDILLQTVEVPLTEFNAPNTSDLARVNKVKIELTPEAYKNAEDKDIFVFNDFIATKRDISMPVTP